MAGMEQLSSELYAKLQRRLCMIEGKQEEEQPRSLDDMAVQPTKSARMRFHADQASKTAAARAARRAERRRKLAVAKPLVPITYLPNSADDERSSGPVSHAQGALRDLMSPVLSDRITAAAEVYEMMDDEENEEGPDEDPYDDYYEALQAFLPVEAMKTSTMSKVVNLLELSEADLDSASICSLDTQEPRSASAMIDRETREEEIQYLQQRLADAYAEREIHLAAAKDDANTKEKALSALAEQVSHAELANADLDSQLNKAKAEAEHWRKEASRLQVSNGELVRAAQVALRALHRSAAT